MLSGVELRSVRKSFDILLSEKKEAERLRYMSEVERALSEGREWDVINKERKRKGEVEGSISMNEWSRYFKDVLGGVDGRVLGYERREVVDDGVNEIELEEIERVIKRLKWQKSPYMDGLENEVWKLGGEKVKTPVWEVCKKVWRGESWPEEWKTGLVVPVPKKVGGKRWRSLEGSS